MYTADSRLADIIYSDFTAIPMLGRFGITLGVGDGTIADVCFAKGIDLDFFLALINAYLGNSDSLSLSVAGIRHLANFLALTNAYYISAALPNIERHFRALSGRSGDVCAENNLQLLWGFFMELKREISSRADSDKESLSQDVGIVEPEASIVRVAELLGGNTETDESIEDKVEDLRSFFIVHLQGIYDQNLCMAVVTSLAVLENDIRRTNRVRALLRNCCK